MEAPPSWRHLNLIPSQRPHLQIPSHWGSGLNIRVLGGMQTFSPWHFLFIPFSSHIHRVPFSCPAAGWGTTRWEDLAPASCNTHSVEIDGKRILTSQCGRGWAGGVHWLLAVHLRGVGWAPEFSRKRRSYKGPQQNVAVWEDTVCLGEQDGPMLGHEDVAADQMGLGGVRPWMLN